MSYHVSVTFNKQLATWQPGVSDNFTSGPWFLKPEPNIQTACRSHRGSCAATHLHHHAWESETLVFGGIPEIAGWFTWTIPAISMDDWGYPYDLGNLEKIGQPKMVKPLWMTCWKFALRITKTGGWKGLELYFKVARDVSLRILRFQVFLARNDWTYLLYHL